MIPESFDSLTERTLGAVQEISSTIGCGFAANVYERALFRELQLRGLRVKAHAPFEVHYKGHFVGECFADLIVEDSLVVELKCVDSLGSEHTARCINHLRASGLNVGLLVNFQRPKVEWRRVICRFNADSGVPASPLRQDPVPSLR